MAVLQQRQQQVKGEKTVVIRMAIFKPNDEHKAILIRLSNLYTTFVGGGGVVIKYVLNADIDK